ncbi:hypothetical protein KSP39_PZI002730 [Platanthera zijinensis]|uniref:Uncharacterized protein n=1 Tax=Platanthera zijinensis TaxID=2320716 RepID=A0AAP0BZ09_9ASPA
MRKPGEDSPLDPLGKLFERCNGHKRRWRQSVLLSLARSFKGRCSSCTVESMRSGANCPGRRLLVYIWTINGFGGLTGRVGRRLLVYIWTINGFGGLTGRVGRKFILIFSTFCTPKHSPIAVDAALDVVPLSSAPLLALAADRPFKIARTVRIGLSSGKASGAALARDPPPASKELPAKATPAGSSGPVREVPPASMAASAVARGEKVLPTSAPLPPPPPAAATPGQTPSTCLPPPPPLSKSDYPRPPPPPAPRAPHHSASSPQASPPAKKPARPRPPYFPPRVGDPDYVGRGSGERGQGRPADLPSSSSGRRDTSGRPPSPRRSRSPRRGEPPTPEYRSAVCFLS